MKNIIELKNMKKTLYLFILPALIFLPTLYVSAQVNFPIPEPDGTLDGFLAQLVGITQVIIGIVMGLALVVFLIGVFQYVISKGMDDKEKARDQIIYGLIGLFVMVSVWGIIEIFTNTFFKTLTNTPPALPTITTR